MKNKYQDIQNTKANIDNSGIDWQAKSFSHPERTIRLGTSFSGIGAIEHSFHRLGLNCEIQFAGDIDENCKKAYFANYNITEGQWHKDIHEFDATPFKGKIDLFVGGAPCQAFSLRGKHGGFEDTRGTLFREFARIIKECQPSVFIFENVQGLFNHDNGKTWGVIKNTFEEYCGYHIFYRRLNSKNYGIPQHRERLFCVGFKDDIDFMFPRPIGCEYTMYDFLLDYRGGQYYVPSIDAKIITPYKERIPGLADGSLEPLFNEFIFPCSEVDDNHYLSETVARYVLAGGTKNFKTSNKTDLEIARPLLQTMHKMHRAGVDNYVTFNKAKGVNGIRRLAPRECFRLMGFRDDFIQKVSNTAAYMQTGNSIVVDVLISLLKQMDITSVIRKC